jgi:hypothetical protein
MILSCTSEVEICLVASMMLAEVESEVSVGRTGGAGVS